MRIGILGSGLMGSKLGTIFARAGHEVVFSYAHSPEGEGVAEVGTVSGGAGASDRPLVSAFAEFPSPLSDVHSSKCR